MSEIIRFVIAALLAGVGIFVIATSVLGVFRFKFAIDRMQCASIIDTFGLLLVAAALCVASGELAFIWKMLVILAVLWLASPLSSHLLASLELMTDETAAEHIGNMTEDSEDIVTEEGNEHGLA